MALTTASRSTTMKLGDVIRRLAGHEEVDGIAVVGSGGTDSLTPVSDYDILVILSHNPVSLDVVLTNVDRRVAEVYFFTMDRIDRIVSEITTIPHQSWDGGIADRLAGGRIVFDRTGRLREAQDTICAALPLAMASEREVYAAWFKINYALRQIKRMLASDDPVYEMTVDYLLLSSLPTLWPAYCTVRRLPWRGEKATIRYFATYDPAYLSLFQECLGEANRERKVQLYETLAGLALAPAGSLWLDEATAADVDGGPEMVEPALAFWEHLLTIGHP